MKKQKLIESEKFARKCDITGEGMDEGWKIGDFFFKYKKDADKHARTIPNEENPEKGNYKSFKQLYNSMDEENNDFCYWTEWEMPTDAQYIVKNGKLVDYEHKK